MKHKWGERKQMPLCIECSQLEEIYATKKHPSDPSALWKNGALTRGRGQLTSHVVPTQLMWEFSLSIQFCLVILHYTRTS